LDTDVFSAPKIHDNVIDIKCYCELNLYVVPTSRVKMLSGHSKKDGEREKEITLASTNEILQQ